MKNNIEYFTKIVNETKDRMNTTIEKLENVNSDINTLNALTMSTIITSSKEFEFKSKSTKTSIVGLEYKNIDFQHDIDSETVIYDRINEVIDKNVTISNDDMELNTSISQSAINNGIKSSTVRISEYSKLGEHKNSLNNIIDLSTATYWNTTIISYDKKFGPFTSKRGFKTKSKGAFLEIEISLEAVRKINYLTLQGYSTFPMEICYIEYSSNDNTYIRQRIKNSEETLYNNSLTLNFEPIMCKKIYIGILQEHCVIANNNSKKLGYEYNIGINYFDAGFKDYEKLGAYETKFITTRESISRLLLVANEVEDAELFDIEYYISTKENPTYKDWISILPKNKDIVTDELLIDMVGACILRFKATEILNVKKNGKIITEDNYSLKEEVTSEEETLIYGIVIKDINFNDIYTVSYVPVEESNYIEFANNDVSPYYNSEILYGNDDNAYELNSSPYSPIGDNVQVEVLDNIKGKVFRQSDDKIANTTGTNDFVFNKTKFQYYIEENKIFFNRDLDDRYVIKVKYNTLKSMFKLKIIMRRNTKGERYKTQVLKNVSIIVEN